MGDYGIKIMKSGYPVTDTDIRNIILSSKYTMLKYHSDQTVQLTIPTGEYSGHVDVTHNLGYVPAFIVYVSHAWYETTQRMVPNGSPGQPLYHLAYATSSIIRCKTQQTWQPVDRTYTFRVIIFKDQIT